MSDLLSVCKRIGRRAYSGGRRRYLVASNYVCRKVRHDKIRVALVSSDCWKNKVLDDLLLQRGLIQRGFDAEIISWQEKKVDYRRYDVFIITSMWGYQNYLNEFNEWLDVMDESGFRVINSLDIIRLNYNKASQIKQLDKEGISHVDTKIVDKNVSDTLKELDTFPYVVKPSISGSGNNTFLIRNESDLEKCLPRLEKIVRSRALMVQPFLKEIEEGELSVVVINGAISHAVRRFPGILTSSKRYRVEFVPIQCAD